MKNPAEAGLEQPWGWLVEACTADALGTIQAQIADHAHVVPAFGKTEKGCLKVGHDPTAMQHQYDHNATTYPDERLQRPWDPRRLRTACSNL